MTTTLDTSCSENTMVLSARPGFSACMYFLVIKYSSCNGMLQNLRSINLKGLIVDSCLKVNTNSTLWTRKDSCDTNQYAFQPRNNFEEYLISSNGTHWHAKYVMQNVMLTVLQNLRRCTCHILLKHDNSVATCVDFSLYLNNSGSQFYIGLHVFCYACICYRYSVVGCFWHWLTTCIK
jgi:hypothetical protein